jgi:hypothetical protein
VPNPAYEKSLFDRKLNELGLTSDFSRLALQGLGDRFTMEELNASLRNVTKQLRARGEQRHSAARKILTLAQSNYEVQFPPDSRLSERVLFPPLFRKETESRTPASFTSKARMAHGPITRLTPRTMATDPAAPSRRGLSSFKFIVERFGRPEQRHGALSAEDQQPLRDVRPAGFGEHLRADLLHFWNTSKLIVEPKFP